MPEHSAVARLAGREAARAAEPKSWGESLKRYDAARTTPAHPDLLAPVPPSKHGVFNANIKPQEFHTIKQVYNDPNREQATRQTEQQRSAAQVEKAQWKADHLANHKPFNILTGVVQPTTNIEVAQKLAQKDASHRTKVIDAPDGSGKRLISFSQPAAHPPARDYNILTNTAAFEGSKERLAKADEKVIPLHNRSVKESREFNVITLRYQYENHAARSEREQKANDAAIRQKYFAQSHYNPVTLQFVHPTEEARYQAARAHAQATHGLGQLANLPPRIKRSEGQCYDILTPGVVKNEEQLKSAYDAKDQRARETRQERHALERGIQTRDQHLDQAAAMKSANRVSTKRFEEQIGRGYDLLSNEPYEGREKKKIFAPQVTAKPMSDEPRAAGMTRKRMPQ